MARKRYRIRVTGKPRTHPDPVMLAQIVILIGRRLHAEQQQQRATGGTRTRPEAGSPPQQQAHPCDGLGPSPDSSRDESAESQS
jgi:hypothetical protein